MSNNIYRNGEGYCDPTAGAAISSCSRKERSDRRKAIRKANAQVRQQVSAENRTLVYICSPFAGDTKNNILTARKYCRFAVRKGYLPFAPHLLFPQFLNDENPAERTLGLSFGNVFMGKCSEIWIFGTEYSAGMQAEYDLAIKKGYKIRYFTTDCRETADSGTGGGNELI